MPVHDWTRVSAGIFHHFHQKWIGGICDTLNDGRLPPGYYALAEQVAGSLGPDVLTLQVGSADEIPPPSEGGLAIAEMPPQVDFVATAEMDQYLLKQNSVVIRHTSGDRIIALVEVLSPGNKASKRGLQKVVEKALAALYHGYHLLLIDLLPPTRRDPQGIHGAIWEELAGEPYVAPAGKPLTVAAYTAGTPKVAYVKTVAVGDELPDMPLFLDPDRYVPIPLETTYRAAVRSIPERWRRVLEGQD